MSVNKPKPLCLSFHCPPAIRPQSILIGKMIPEWLKQGLQPVIITYDSNADWNINAPVYQINGPNINEFFKKILFFRGFLRQRYYHKVSSIAAQVLKKHNLNLIFSFANPQDSNIIGAMLAKRTGIRFISHFSDPWYDNPYSSFTGLTAKMVLARERFIIKHSNRVIFTNKQAQDLVMKKYPADWRAKAIVIPHCFQPQDYPEAQKKSPNQFVFSHIGAFYKQRNPELFFQALSSVINNNQELASKVRVELVGAANKYSDYPTETIKQIIAKYKLTDIVEIIPIVDYQSSLRYMKSADCLIVIDADFQNSPFLPSKVIDYAGSGTNILGITPKHSPTAEFLTNLGYSHFNYSQTKKLSDYLEKLILGTAKITVNQSYLKKFNVSFTTAQLIEQFSQVLNN